MSPFRPDLVDVWIFRERTAPSSDAAGSAAAPASEAAGGARPASPTEIEILLMRRSPGRILPGLWQCVSGSLEAGESVVAGALRELSEETGFGPAEIIGFYDLDQVNQFHEPSVQAIVSAAVFAVRVGNLAEPILSHEHDAMEWATPDLAVPMAVWPAYRESIRRIVENLLDPELAVWFGLTLNGERVLR
jgi:8-oxo-dGTP pyrophosphatase MutT (NUDIX family)